VERNLGITPGLIYKWRQRYRVDENSDELEASAAYHAFLASLPEDDEEVWERPGRSADGGGFTLNDQLVLSAYHDLDHLHQIVKIMRF